MRRDYLIFAGLAILFFFPFLGGVHLFDWDEINFAESAREMLATGDYFRPQIDFEPFWEKPPLFIWMQALSMHIFGVTEFAARFPNAVCGLLTLLMVYHIGLKLHDRYFGWLWALSFLGSILPHLYFRSGIIDPWFNFFIFTSIYGFIQFRWQFFSRKPNWTFWMKFRYLILGGLALGLAIMTKGPTAYLIAFLTLMTYWGLRKFRSRCYFKHFITFSAAAAVVSLLWFGLEIALHGTWFITEFITYQIRLLTTPDAGHGGFFGYHFVVLLLGCFPASVFAIPNLWGDQQPEEEVMSTHTLAVCQRSDFATWMQILFWVVLILFSVVSTKIVHYSSLCYFPLTYLGSLTLWRAIHWGVKPKISGILLPVLGVLIGGLAASLPYLGQHLDLLKPLFANDNFALENLKANIHWELWQGWPGIVLAVGSLVGYWYWRINNPWNVAHIVFGSGAVFVTFTLAFYIRNIEGISQLSAIEFYESKKNEDCYIRTLGYKSFAHLFYSAKKPVVGDVHQDDMEHLLHEQQTKPVYLVAKLKDPNHPPTVEGFKELYRKNGFVFLEKKAGQ
jgi:4-amino-4-deoxy-L-arabinose transferase-like glycosyltransferase